MWVTSFFKKISEKWKDLELNQYNQKLSLLTQYHFLKKIKNFDFDRYFDLSERERF